MGGSEAAKPRAWGEHTGLGWRRLTYAAALCLVQALPSPESIAQPVDPPLRELRSWSLTQDDLAKPRARRFSYGLRLEMAMLRGTRWAPGVIFDGVKGAAAILAQCGIRLEFARLREFDGPRRYRYLSTPDSREFARRTDLQRPAIFFVDDTRQRSAFEAEAVGRANASTRPEMTDTVWVISGVRDLPVALAHELVHVLTDSGEHSDRPGNLMRDETTPHNTRLTREQCSRIVATGRVNGLLDRAPDIRR